MFMGHVVVVIQYLRGIINSSYDDQFKLLLQGQEEEEYHKKSASQIAPILS
jgi:hypothetical protein